MKFFFVAQSTLPVGWIKLRGSVDQLQFYVVIGASVRRSSGRRSGGRLLAMT